MILEGLETVVAGFSRCEEMILLISFFYWFKSETGGELHVLLAKSAARAQA
jgi:hypothetical protein